MAFISSSPPPMMPDDEDIEDDVDEFGGHLDDDEDEDSAAFDLTGMSAKLQSIPKETIQVAPKEVVLSTNGVITLEDSLKPLGISQIDDLHSDNSSQDLSIDLKEESEIPEPVDVISDPMGHKIFVNSEQKEVKEEVVDQIEVDEHSDLEQNQQSDEEVTSKQFEKIGNDDSEHVQVASPESTVLNGSPESPIEDTSSRGSLEIDERKETFDSPEPPVQDDSIEEPTEIKPEQEDKCSPVQAESPDQQSEPKVEICDVEDDDPEDDFGDFAEVPPLQLDDNDSDFGDFEEETTKDEFASASGWASLDTSPRGKLDQILIGLQLKLSSVISTLFSVVLDTSSPANEEIFDSVIPMLDLAKEDCQDDSVWLQIHNIQSTPALNQKWKDSLSRQRLLTLLNIDPKYVIHQEVVVKPKNSVHKSGSAVPAFASGLGMTLEPIKAKTTNSSNEKEQHRPIEVEQPPAAEVVGVNTSKDSIEDVATAPFEDKKDSSSAMVATASSASEVKVASRPPVAATALPSLLPNEDDYRGTTTTTTTTTSPKRISASAQNIIDSFPLLDFMQSTVLTKL